MVVADIQDDLGRELAAELGERCAFIHLDVTDESQWQHALSEVRRLAGAPVRILLFTAGVICARPITSLTRADFVRVTDVCLTGAFLAIRSTAEQLAEAGSGSVVLISSVDGLAGVPTFAAYSAAKAGMLGLMRVAAVELAADGIRVNAIAPGAIDTPMTRAPHQPASVLDTFARQIPLRRVGRPEDIADASMYLASLDAGWVTGTILTVDGGSMARVPLSLEGWTAPDGD